MDCSANREPQGKERGFLHASSFAHEFLTLLSAVERSNCCLICRFVATELFSNHGLSQYVDPSNYGDPMEAVKTFAAEIDRNQIKLERTVGGGVYNEIRDHMFL